MGPMNMLVIITMGPMNILVMDPMNMLVTAKKILPVTMIFVPMTINMLMIPSIIKIKRKRILWR